MTASPVTRLIVCAAMVFAALLAPALARAGWSSAGSFETGPGTAAASAG
jgi:hypothetical protein